MSENWNKSMQDTYHENLLDELYKLTLIEQEGALHEDERKRYVEIVEVCQSKNIEIPFGIEI